jgi:UPF0716 protein FxsA
MRRWLPWWVSVLLFIGLPVLEIYVLIQVGQVIGAWWTVLLLVADGVLGAYLLKREGRRAWRALREALAAGRMPATELADGALILVGGTLLLTPGFVSDVFGFFLVLPLTRPLARRVVARFVNRKLAAGSRTSEATRTRQRPGPDSVVQGEVVDD